MFALYYLVYFVRYVAEIWLYRDLIKNLKK